MGYLLFALLLFFNCSTVGAAPRRLSYGEEQHNLESVRHEVNNHEAELRMLEERINNQEQTLSSLRQQLIDALQVNKDLVKGSTTTMEGKLQALDTLMKAIQQDLSQLKTHANEISAALNKNQQKIQELERTAQQQGQNTDNLHTAVQALTDALQLKECPTTSSQKGYRVKSGDSLQKIAKAHGTTTRALKELNQLKNDRILIGQTLQIP